MLEGASGQMDQQQSVYVWMKDHDMINLIQKNIRV